MPRPRPGQRAVAGDSFSALTSSAAANAASLDGVRAHHGLPLGPLGVADPDAGVSRGSARAEARRGTRPRPSRRPSARHGRTRAGVARARQHVWSWSPRHRPAALPYGDQGGAVALPAVSQRSMSPILPCASRPAGIASGRPAPPPVPRPAGMARTGSRSCAHPVALPRATTETRPPTTCATKGPRTRSRQPRKPSAECDQAGQGHVSHPEPPRLAHESAKYRT